MLLEICTPNLESARLASTAGAHRIELCSGLELGGLTPSAGLIRAAVAHCTCPVMVLIRPREGHFHYSNRDLSVMADDIRFCRDAGAHGVAIGALDDRHMPDQKCLETLVRSAQGLDLTFHRAFDLTTDPFSALDTLIQLGFNRVLTSGQAPTAPAGADLLRRLTQYAAGRLAIMPGAGIQPRNLAALALETGAREFHMSAKRLVPSPPGLAGLPGLENSYWASDAATIREALKALEYKPLG